MTNKGRYAKVRNGLSNLTAKCF